MTTAKSAAKQKTAASQDAHALPAPAPWTCRDEAAKSCIDAYVEVNGEWETIVEIPAGNGVNAKATAAFITRLANDYEATDFALRSALTAIQELVECAGGPLTYDAEQEAEIAEQKIKAILEKR